MPNVYFSAEAASGGLVGALGLDLRALVFNTIAFLLVVAVLRRFVYPSLIGALDAKKSQLEAAAKAEANAKAKLAEASNKAEELIAIARSTADEVVATARTEAGEMVDSATSKAEAQAKRIVQEAHEQTRIDVDKARHELAAETARLVAQATGIVLDEKIDATKDAAIIQRGLQGGKV